MGNPWGFGTTLDFETHKIIYNIYKSLDEADRNAAHTVEFLLGDFFAKDVQRSETSI